MLRTQQIDATHQNLLKKLRVTDALARCLVPVRPEQIIKILELTDSFNIHREAVTIPLGAEKDGSVTLLPDGRLRIVCPEDMGFDEWLKGLQVQLGKTDLTRLVKH